MVPDWPCTVNIRHKVSRQIIATEEAVKCYKEGKRVVLLHCLHCNTCHYCLNGHHMVCETLRKTSFDHGGWVEYVRMPVINVDRGIFVLPDHVSYEDATFFELLAYVLRGQRLAHLQPGSSIDVISSGIADLLQVMLARAFAAHRVVGTDTSEYRLEAARRLGIDVTPHPQKDLPSRLCQVIQGLLADLVSAVAQALESVKRDGQNSMQGNN
jgi:L-iditol 2-dehydrogenase